jgi:hypothetical protein
LNCAIGLLGATETSIERQFAALPLKLHPAVTQAAFPSLPSDGYLPLRCNELSTTAITHALQAAAHEPRLKHLSLTNAVLPDAQGFSSTACTPQQLVFQQNKYSQLKASIEVKSHLRTLYL